MPTIVTRPAGGATSLTTGSFAPSDETYLVLTASSGLTNERVVSVGEGVTFVDDGTSLTFSINKVFQEVPSGSQDGVNTVFTTAFTPSPRESLQVFRRGLHMMSGSSGLECDYFLSGSNTIVMKRPPAVDDTFFVNYFR